MLTGTRVHRKNRRRSIVLTTDQAGFVQNGDFNSHNTHIWSEENPHQIRERGFQQRFSINLCLTSLPYI
jgi:hypothetical protein